MTTDILIFYGVASVVFGGLFYARGELVMRWRGRDLNMPRIVAAAICGLLWPYALVCLILGY